MRFSDSYDIYCAAGFDAVVSDNIFEKNLLDVLEMAFAENRTIHLVVLNPLPHVIRARYADRPGGGYAGGITPRRLMDAVAKTPRLGLRLDNGEQTPRESAVEILRRRSETAVTRLDVAAPRG
jgi:hypothetical protein